MKTEKVWAGKFGNDYTKRNLDSSFRNIFIVSERITQELLNNIPKDSKILEVGCNIGNKLKILQDMGYTNLSGIDICKLSLGIAKKKHPSINFCQASLFNLPFEDNEFDMVFSCGVLIHIHPDDLPKAMSEIYRCSNNYIYGYEYYRPICKGYNYRDGGILCWRNDFLKSFLKQFLDLVVVKKKFEMRNLRDWRRIYLLRKLNMKG